MLERSRCRLPIKITPLFLKDSLELTTKDLQRIKTTCRNSREKSLVITHGTDTMVETVKQLADLKLDKTIVLTGAMIPYAFGHSSDGFFSLGAAFAFAQSLPHNV